LSAVLGQVLGLLLTGGFEFCLRSGPIHVLAEFHPLWNVFHRRQKLEDIVLGVFTPGLAKHSKSFSLIDCIPPELVPTNPTFHRFKKHSWLC
jgi:hypothetical protein